MSALLDKIKELEKEMLIQATMKIQDIKSIKFTEEDEVYIGVVNRHLETIEVQIKEIKWVDGIKIISFDEDWGEINMWNIYDDDVIYIYDLILDYNA